MNISIVALLILTLGAAIPARADFAITGARMATLETGGQKQTYQGLSVYTLTVICSGVPDATDLVLFYPVDFNQPSGVNVTLWYAYFGNSVIPNTIVTDQGVSLDATATSNLVGGNLNYQGLAFAPPGFTSQYAQCYDDQGNLLCSAVITMTANNFELGPCTTNPDLKCSAIADYGAYTQTFRDGTVRVLVASAAGLTIMLAIWFGPSFFRRLVHRFA